MESLNFDSLEVLLRIAEGGDVSKDAVHTLAIAETESPDLSISFGIKGKNRDAAVKERLQFLQAKYGAFCGFCDRQGLIPRDLLPTLWQVWLPLAEQLIAKRQQLDRPLIQGILGMQGAGKTTMGLALEALLEPEYRVLSFSIDDIYKTWAERRRLREADPRLIWRGPPGTHDVGLGIEVLQRLRRGEAEVPVPVFDKALAEGQGDRVAPRPVSDADIVLFDGWFVGVQPVDPQIFSAAPQPIVTEADRAFARDCNDWLRAYLPLWAELDGLIVLALSDFQLSKRWRIEAEQRLRAEGRGGMSDAEVGEFVDYFWKALHPALFVEPLLQQAADGGADLVIEVGEGHGVQRVYCP